MCVRLVSRVSGVKNTNAASRRLCTAARNHAHRRGRSRYYRVLAAVAAQERARVSHVGRGRNCQGYQGESVRAIPIGQSVGKAVLWLIDSQKNRNSHSLARQVLRAIQY